MDMYHCMCVSSRGQLTDFIAEDCKDDVVCKCRICGYRWFLKPPENPRYISAILPRKERDEICPNCSSHKTSFDSSKKPPLPTLVYERGIPVPSGSSANPSFPYLTKAYCAKCGHEIRNRKTMGL